MNVELGKRIAALRKAGRVTQSQLAEYLAVQPQTVSRWEAEGGAPDVTLLPKIAVFFGVSMDDLFGMTDMDRIDDLVYKYSVLRDDKSFKEVMRALDRALEVCEEQNRRQLCAWKIHVLIQKSRKAQQDAEELLDELLGETATDELSISLRLQKQQFRIQSGEGRKVLNETGTLWEREETLASLYCYMAALSELDKGRDILSLWEKETVQKLVGEISEQSAPLWNIYFRAAASEQALSTFLAGFQMFRTSASDLSVFEAGWTLAHLYRELSMEEELEECRKELLRLLEALSLNEYLKEWYQRELRKL